MDNLELFTAALMLNDPWFVSDVSFVKEDNTDKMELHITIDFVKGSLFQCPHEGCNEMLSAYDTKQKTWRHLNFFQYKTFIHARVPRVKCEKHGSITLVDVPWSRPESGFTMLFEGWVIELAKHLPVDTIARHVDEHDTRLWRVIHHYTNKARATDDQSEVTMIGIDETSKKGHNYITVVADLVKKRVLYVCKGKDSSTVTQFVTDFKEHKGDPDKIKIVTCDMSLGFKKGIRENFENSRQVIDKFHVIKHINEAVDKVRKTEVKDNPLLRNTKYIWLKNEENLTEKQKKKKEALSKKRLKTSRACGMKETLQSIYEECGTREEAQIALKKLHNWLTHSRLEPMKDFAKLLKNHIEDILNYFDYKYTNAILEGMNSIIQNIKRRARGFKNDDYFSTMIYLVCGKLDYSQFFSY